MVAEIVGVLPPKAKLAVVVPAPAHPDLAVVKSGPSDQEDPSYVS